MKKEFRIPTVFGLIVLLAGTFAGVFLLRQNGNKRSVASGTCDPGAIQTSNVTDKSADISFVTTNSCIANLSLNNRIINDTRSSGGSDGFSAKTHYFQIDGLEASQEFPYSIISGGNTYSNSSYKFITAKKPASTIPTTNLAWGRILTNSLKPASTAIIYISIPGSSLLSSYVTSSGNWNISLATSFNEAKNSWFTPVANTDEDITVISENDQPVILTGNTSYNNPVPDIIIGQTARLIFTKSTPTSTGKISNTQAEQTASTKRLIINNPKEGESIAGISPLILGIANPNTLVALRLSSAKENLSTSITSKADGLWSWPITQNLSSGEITIIAESSGETFMRKFIVSGSISGPAFVASPSAKTSVFPITPTTASISPTIILPTNTPTSIVEPTIRASRPSTSSAVPVTGFSFPTIIVVIIGLTTIIGSLLLIR